MGVGAGLCMYDVVVKSLRSLSHSDEFLVSVPIIGALTLLVGWQKGICT